jgi:hypothetical protein
MASYKQPGQFLPDPRVLSPLLALLFIATAFPQEIETETGKITGTVQSTAGVPIADAKVIITSKDTGKTAVVRTQAQGTFASADIPATEYNVRVDARSFISTQQSVTVKAGATSSVNIRLLPQPLPGVVVATEIDRFPLRTQNFVQLLQVEPGVQNQNAGTLAAGKNAFSSVSLFGRFGDQTPIESDGVNLADSAVGGVVQDLPPGAVQEFQFGGLLAPIAHQLYAPGTVNIVTRSGSDQLHGNLFGFYGNGDVLSASLPGGRSHHWGRQQFGGNLGGALIADKLRFFVDVERNRQDLSNRILPAGAFTALSPSSTTLSEPFREIEGSGRLDYKLSDAARAFYRFAYDQNSDLAPFSSGPSLQPLLARTNTPSHTVGLDLSSGSFLHAFRFQYLKFRNLTADAYSEVPTFTTPRPNFSIEIGGGSTKQCASGALICLGPSPFANQQNYQSDIQFRYDGSVVRGQHAFHFGASYDRILVGRFDPLYALAPTLSDSTTVPLPAGVLGSSGVPSDPLAYPVEWAYLGNGRGFASEKSAFGMPAGGLTDHQLSLYGGDTWKVMPTLALSFGVHWVRDTVPNNSDLAKVPVLNLWQPKLGNPVRQPNLNFAPQVGVVWDPSGDEKTTIRGGLGMFYGPSSFMNAYLDRPLRLQQGTYLTTPAACVGGASGSILWPSSAGAAGTIINGAGIVNFDGTVSPYDPSSIRTWCGESMRTAGPLALALEQAYQTATAAAGSNASFMGKANSFAGPYQNGLSLIDPDYQTPRTVQFDAGLRHELRPGLIFTLDYLREATTRTLLGVDVNHGGAAATFNAINAIADRNAAQLTHGCPIGSGQVSCMVAKLGPIGALDAYGAAGIGGPAQVTGGAPCPYCAFPGVHPNLGVNVVNVPEGRSVYNGFLFTLNQEVTSFSHGVQHVDFHFSYAYSHYVSQGEDTAFSLQATNFDNPDRYTGSSALDRTQQFSFGAHFDLQHSFELSLLSHFASPLPVTLRFQQIAGGAEVLVTDGNGDGTTGDIVPGSNVGAYMRSFNASGVQRFIADYNATFPNSATPLTPAGTALTAAGVFSLPDLKRLGAVLQPLASPVPSVAGLGWFKTFDVRLGWTRHFGERITVVPSVSVYNLFNFANFDLPGYTQNGVLNFGAGSLLSSTSVQPQNTVGGNSSLASSRLNRASLQPGMNASGAARSVEWGLKISF